MVIAGAAVETDGRKGEFTAAVDDDRGKDKGVVGADFEGGEHHVHVDGDEFAVFGHRLVLNKGAARHFGHHGECASKKGGA